MVTLEHILDAYFRARKNKKKSPDQVKFQIHWEMNCVRLWKAINTRKFKPRTYAFVTMKPKPREIFACDMATRIIHHYIDIRTRDIIENILGPNSYNNRIGMGTSGAIKSVRENIQREKDSWIIKLDLKACFPSIPREKACDYFIDSVMSYYNEPDKEDLIWMIKTCMLHDPSINCEKRGDLELWKNIPPYKSLFNTKSGYGAAIGHLIWQTAVNLYFHPLDQFLDTIPGIKHTRYVDDIYIVTKNKDLFLSYIPKIRDLLDSMEAALNENKFYCQPCNKGVECLGYHIKNQRLHLNNRIIWRAKKTMKTFKSGEKNKKKVISSINSYLGLCKFGTGFKKGIEILLCLEENWWKELKFNSEKIKVITI